MKKYSKKIVAITLTLLIVFGWGSTQFVASNMVDSDFNMNLLNDDNVVKAGLEDDSFAKTELKTEGLAAIDKNAVDGEITDKDTLSLGASGNVATLGLSIQRATFGIQDSIGGIIMPVDAAKVVIVPGTDGSVYQSYDGTLAGLQQALFELYTNGAGADYVVYVGSNITVPLGAPIAAEVPPATVTAGNVSFTALKGKVGTLVLTSSITDPTTTTTSAPADAKILYFNTNLFFGTNAIFRNIRYTSNSIFAMGNNLTLDRGSYFNTGGNIYGGTGNGDVAGNPTININSTGSGTTNVYGANQLGGTLTGNPTVIINNASVGIFTNLSGGAEGGTVVGDVTLTVNGTATNGISYIYSGGKGSAGNPAHVTGNVSSTINGMSGGFAGFYGGVSVGNVFGSLTNNVSGTGGGGTGYFYGGSAQGNIGFGLPEGSTAIKTVFDSSKYTAGFIVFVGGNTMTGTITGNIHSTVTAAESRTAGYIRNVSGAGGQDTKTTGIALGAFVGKTPEEARAMAEAAANFKVYGNVYTEITKGRVSNGSGDSGYARGGGYGGYIQGDTTIEVGTQGLATSTVPVTPETSQTSAVNTRGYNTGFDIVGGGGNPGAGNTYFQYGKSKVVIHNALARWTYGANFSGSTYGDTRIEIYDGVVDTLEGAGYNGQQLWGNPTAHVYDGQVDWFLSGGGWNDTDIYGSPSVVVEKGTINASMGGTYGHAQQTIYGNTDILVNGGSFSGKTRTGLNGFSGGATQAGKILGNSKVTLDLRGATGNLGLPVGSYITGGRPYNALADSILGTDANNTIELNVYTDPGSNILNGASIYGDGGGAAASTRSGSISINIDAPDSAVGSFFATQYSNVLLGKILRNVEFNIYNLNSISGLSGGNSNDNFTNAIVNAGTNQVTMNFNPAAVAGDTKKTFSIGSMGAFNFTKLNLNNAILDVVGGVKNGRSSTAANHGTTYHQFGDINMVNDSGMIIGNIPVAMISANMLTVDGKSTLTSPSGTGKVIVTDITIGADDSIVWSRNGGSILASENGNWFGTNDAYKVITFDPVPANATKLTPHNFSGADGTLIYLGDNETTSIAGKGHGIAIPGTRIEYKVVGGTGTIKHNVDKVSSNDTPPLNGASSVGKDVPVSDEGWLSVTDTFLNPQLTFTPDSATGSWIKEIKIVRNDGQTTTIPEATDSDAIVWPVPAKGYVYTVEVIFTNLSEITGRSVLVTETEAAAILSAEDIMTYQQISGRPFLINDINAALIPAIQQPLGATEKIRSHKATYTVGVAGSPTTKEYWVSVVPDKAIIHLPSRAAAIDANDATMMLAAAQGITDATLNADYTKPYLLFPNGTTSTPAFSGTPIVTLNGLIAPATVPVTYTYTSADPVFTLNKTVNVVVIPDGVIQFESVPTLNFGQTAIPDSRVSYWMPVSYGIVVEDSRGVAYGSTWKVHVKVTDLDSAGTEKILASDVTYTNKDPLAGAVGQFPLDSAVVVWNGQTSSSPSQGTIWPSNGDYGFAVTLDPATTKVGDYSGTATWSLIEGP